MFVLQSAASHQWRAANGHLLEMDTPQILRARELRDLYNNISMDPVDKKQRHHFLMALKDTIKVIHNTAQDIYELIVSLLCSVMNFSSFKVKEVNDSDSCEDLI